VKPDRQLALAMGRPDEANNTDTTNTHCESTNLPASIFSIPIPLTLTKSKIPHTNTNTNNPNPSTD
jgi:hypothetical protein